ncbi:MAG: hypothetical protein GF401_04265 [Chitinivibrionales bacterium]|nr:hypothetical protein [Chitinivibrionales bacterium]
MQERKIRTTELIRDIRPVVQPGMKVSDRQLKGRRSMEFISQKRRPHADYACGVACLAMLLRHRNRDERVDYQELARRLRIDQKVTKKWGNQYEDCGLGAYPADITKYLKEEGIPFLHIHDAEKCHSAGRALLSIVASGPTMAGMNWGKEGHWVVLVTEENGQLSYLDPAKTANEPHKSSITDQDLLAQWDGFAIQLLR